MKLLDIIKLADPEQCEALDSYVYAHVPSFLEVWRRHPLRKHHGSYVSLSEAFWLYRFATDLRPALCVESGTHHGFSAWFLHEAISGRLLTYDPTCSPICKDVLPRWEHRREDFRLCQESPTMVFFDDHQTKDARLQQSRERRIRHVLFHDVDSWFTFAYPVFQFPKLRQEPFNQRELSGHRNLTYIGL